MKKIYKYPVPITDEFTLKLPEGAKILTFQAQDSKPYIWALVDPIGQMETVSFKLFGTGHLVGNADTLEHVGTIQIEPFVWHLFEVV
ncbi:hypothetical protein ES705_40903 [subsurface metagenome]